jgi:hypothetical protein
LTEIQIHRFARPGSQPSPLCRDVRPGALFHATILWLQVNNMQSQRTRRTSICIAAEQHQALNSSPFARYSQPSFEKAFTDVEPLSVDD